MTLYFPYGLTYHHHHHHQHYHAVATQEPNHPIQETTRTTDTTAADDKTPLVKVLLVVLYSTYSFLLSSAFKISTSNHCFSTSACTTSSRINDNSQLKRATNSKHIQCICVGAGALPLGRDIGGQGVHFSARGQSTPLLQYRYLACHKANLGTLFSALVVQ